MSEKLENFLSTLTRGQVNIPMKDRQTVRLTGKEEFLNSVCLSRPVKN